MFDHVIGFNDSNNTCQICWRSLILRLKVVILRRSTLCLLQYDHKIFTVGNAQFLPSELSILCLN